MCKYYCFLFFLITCFHAEAQFSLVVMESLNVAADGYNGNGLSFYDFNGDGYDDASLVSGDGEVRFFENDAGTGFIEVDLDLEINHSGNDAKMITWVDVDNDLDLDLFITFYLAPCQLWLNNGAMEFSNISVTSGIHQTNNWETNGASWGDFNNDGFLDVYLNNYNVEGIVTNYLYQNNGDGTFSDVTSNAGCSNDSQNSFQSLWFDYDNDLWLDLIVINDRLQHPNAIYHNNGDGTFTDVSLTIGFAQAIYAMSISCADYDNDDDMDVYVSNGLEGNIFMQYNDGQFLDIASVYDMEVFSICWGAVWVDHDCDMDQDLFVGTYVWNEDASANAYYEQTTGDFERNDELIAFDESNVYAAALGDFDNNGLPDLMLHTLDAGSSVMYRNLGTENHWTTVSLQGTVSNTQAVGSLIELWSGGTKQTRFTYLGENYFGQSSQTEFFGLGSNTTIDSLNITFPSGITQYYCDLPVDSNYQFVEGVGIEFDIQIDGDLCDNTTNTLFVDYDPTLTYQWNTGADSSAIEVDGEGLYSLAITDEFGITSTAEINIDLFPSPVLESNITNTTCHGNADGMIEVFNVSGIPIASCIWNTGTDDQAIFGLNAGLYSYVCTDDNGCQAVDTLEVMQPDSITANEIIANPLCFGEFGSISISPTGGTGTLTIDWSNLNPDALLAGEYSVTIVDANSCYNTLLFGIQQPDELLGEIELTEAFDGDNGFANASAEGGTPPYTFQWSNGDMGESATNLGQGVYVLNITDDNGCTWSDSFEIIDLNVVSPSIEENFIVQNLNGDLYFWNQAMEEAQLQLFSYNGKLIESRTCPAYANGSMQMETTGLCILVVTMHDQKRIIKVTN